MGVEGVGVLKHRAAHIVRVRMNMAFVATMSRESILSSAPCDIPRLCAGSICAQFIVIIVSLYI
jgi:hypothetical protein